MNIPPYHLTYNSRSVFMHRFKLCHHIRLHATAVMNFTIAFLRYVPKRHRYVPYIKGPSQVEATAALVQEPHREKNVALVAGMRWPIC